MEFEYKGSPQHINEYVREYIDQILDSKMARAAQSDAPMHRPEEHRSSESSKSNSTIELSVTSLATHLSVNTGPELIIAAAAKLKLSDGKDKFSRKEILEEMQDAPSFFRPTYAKNMTQNLGSLIKFKKLNETSKNTFALTARELARLREIILDNADD